MDFKKIEEFLIRYKKYILIGLVIIFGIFVLKNNDQASDNGSNLINQQQAEKDNNGQNSSSMSSATNNQKEQPKEITCDISGAVNEEGVYTLTNGARLDELIKAAGGLRKNAQLKAINRALILKDQEKVHIPFKGEKVTRACASGDPQTENSRQEQETDSGNKINLNQASSSDLQKLNGIGQKKAEQIIAYRQEKGEFKKIEDLMQVSGIGEKTFAALKDKITI